MKLKTYSIKIYIPEPCYSFDDDTYYMLFTPPSEIKESMYIFNLDIPAFLSPKISMKKSGEKLHGNPLPVSELIDMADEKIYRIRTSSIDIENIERTKLLYNLVTNEDTYNKLLSTLLGYWNLNGGNFISIKD